MRRLPGVALFIVIKRCHVWCPRLLVHPHSKHLSHFTVHCHTMHLAHFLPGCIPTLHVYFLTLHVAFSDSSHFALHCHTIWRISYQGRRGRGRVRRPCLGLGEQRCGWLSLRGRRISSLFTETGLLVQLEQQGGIGQGHVIIFKFSHALQVQVLCRNLHLAPPPPHTLTGTSSSLAPSLAGCSKGSS